MATAAYLNSPMRTVKGQQVVNTLKPVIRVNRTQIISHGSVAAIAGPGGMAAPITSITYLITNATAGVLTYVIGDPNLLVAGAHGAVWTQPTGVRNGSVAGVQGSFSSNSVAIAGLNYTVSDALQYNESLMYRSADRDGRYYGQPINIDAILRNNQEIATRQTIRFDSDYLLDDLNCFTLVVPAGRTVTMSLLLGGNMA